jgi:hypothetical protein
MFHINDKVTFKDKDNTNNKSIGKIMRVLRNNNVIVKKIISKNDWLLTKINTSSIINNNSKKNDIYENVYLTKYEENISKESDEYENNYKTYNSDRTYLLSNYKYQQLFDIYSSDKPTLLWDTILPLFILTVFINFMFMIIYFTYVSFNLY